MHWIRFAILLCVTAVLQAALVDVVAIRDIEPNLMLILLVFFCIFGNSTEAIITSFTIGFGADLVGPAMGPGMVSYGVLGTVMAYVNRVVALSSKPGQGIAIFILGLGTGLLSDALTMAKSLPVEPDIWVQNLATAGYSAVIGPFLLVPIGWCMGIRTDRAGAR